MEPSAPKLPEGRPVKAFDYWRSATDPGHRHSSPWWTEFYARELLLYFPKGCGSVLECGCGTGTFFPWIRDLCSDYVGVDFSDSMLKAFSKDWPEVELVCSDAANLPIGEGKMVPESFDFIFSNQVCQFFDRGGVRSHLDCVSKLLRPGGQVLVANVPDAQLRLHFYAGALRSDRNRSWIRGAKNIAIATIGNRDGIGHWYTRQFLAEEASRFGFETTSFSSASLEYRFHILLRRK